MSDAQQATDSVQQSQEAPEGPVILPPYKFDPEPEDEAAPEEAAEVEAAAEDEAEGEEQPERDEKGRFRKVKPAQPRFDELTRKNGELEREMQFWKSQAEANRARQEAAAEQEPSEADFEGDYPEYVRALSRFEARREAAAIVRETREAEAAAKQGQERNSAWNAAAEKARASYQDYDAVTSASDIQLTPHLQELLLSSDVGPHLSYQIAMQPEIAERLNRLPPLIAAKEIARMEDRIEKQPDAPPTPAPSATARKTNAPRPVTPISAQRTTTPNPQNMSAEEYVAYREAQNPVWKRFR